VAGMAYLKKPFQDGFILTGKRLETICSSLTKQMEIVADTVNTSFKLKYVTDIEVDRPDIASVLKEDNGGKQAIKVLTILLNGIKNNINTASISLTFAVDIVDSIVYEITSTDEAWFKNALPLLDSLVNDTIKQSTSRNMRKIASQVREIKEYRIIPYFSYIEGIADYLLEYFGKSFISSDYVFLWGDAIDAFNKRQDLVKNILQVIVVAIVIGLLVGIAAGLIANYITIYVFKWH
jgi:hypothetical protein